MVMHKIQLDLDYLFPYRFKKIQPFTMNIKLSSIDKGKWHCCHLFWHSCWSLTLRFSRPYPFFVINDSPHWIICCYWFGCLFPSGATFCRHLSYWCWLCQLSPFGVRLFYKVLCSSGCAFWLVFVVGLLPSMSLVFGHLILIFRGFISLGLGLWEFLLLWLHYSSSLEEILPTSCAKPSMWWSWS